MLLLLLLYCYIAGSLLLPALLLCYHITGTFFPGVFLSSRVTGACPVTTDLIMRANVRTTTTTTTTFLCTGFCKNQHVGNTTQPLWDLREKTCRNDMAITWRLHHRPDEEGRAVGVSDASELQVTRSRETSVQHALCGDTTCSTTCWTLFPRSYINA